MTSPAQEDESPWHEGERAQQERAGVAGRLAEIGPRVIRSFMPEQHRVFFEQLPSLVVATLDEEQRPQATIVEGAPGFVRSPDPVTLAVAAALPEGDPARSGLAAQAPVALLGLEPHTRRRNRANGEISALTPGGFSVHVRQSFGNCPQYIRRRGDPFPAIRERKAPILASSLGAPQVRDALALVASADTFFVASFAGRNGRTEMDVSHRGGPPGFVRVEGNVLEVPDYQGNYFFNTLGNFAINPRAGLLFVDFASGTLAHLSGSVELVFDRFDPAISAERYWRVAVEQIVLRPGALSLQLTDLDPPSSPAGG